MRSDLYADLFKEEDTHWWHVAKRNALVGLIEKYIQKKAGSRILDIGCGTGKNMMALEVFGEVFGVDPSADAIDFAKSRGLTRLIKSDVDNLKTNDAYFDVVTMLDVLEHVEESALDQVYRTLKNDGLLVIHVPAYEWLWSKWDEILHHKRRYAVSSLKKALADHNFEVVWTSHHFSYLVAPAFIVRFIKSKMRKTEEYTSDFQNTNFLIQNIFLSLSAIERKLMMLGFSIPFGTSVICLAKKKQK